MATCDCDLGLYEDQFRRKRDESKHHAPWERFTLSKARKLGLIDPAAQSRVEHYRHARKRETELEAELSTTTG